MTTFEILSAIWHRSRGPYVFLPTKWQGQWVEGDPVLTYNLQEAQAIPMPEGRDLYFTPARYRLPERSEAATGELGVLYADLDGNYDPDRLAEYPPSILWETSPGSLQAVWFLDAPLVNMVFDLNRRLSVYLGADHGSWIPTKLLRIPGSVNHKRGGVVGQILDFEPRRVYEWLELDQQLPEVMVGSIVVTDHPPIPDDKQWRATMEKWWPRMDHRTKRMLLSPQVPDRSLHLARLAKRLAGISMPPHEIFGTLSKLATNKFANRPQVLWESVVLTALNEMSAVPEAVGRE